jgi:hypothetical protein
MSCPRTPCPANGRTEIQCLLISVTSPPSTTRKLPGITRLHRRHVTEEASRKLSFRPGWARAGMKSPRNRRLGCGRRHPAAGQSKCHTAGPRSRLPCHSRPSACWPLCAASNASPRQSANSWSNGVLPLTGCRSANHNQVQLEATAAGTLSGQWRWGRVRREAG